ncbi:stonin-2 [Gadus morhua]|uniref:stonin-2 n=1 Tax=Gadus morhua TaxID=8049 RepID=UPI0011B4BD74|nr:stonin-2 [Gadus morhua]XP_030212642.1 stonin-2 [Gadus morhua]
MATAADGCPPDRRGWVEFVENASGPRTEPPAVAHGFLESSSAPADPSSAGLAPPAPQNAWVLFDENPWASPPPPPQVKARHSVCSTASFWSTAPTSESSWTGQSEQSLASSGASPCDLSSVDPGPEEPSLTSADACTFSKDEGIDVDSLSCSSGGRQTSSSPSDAAGRLTSWVTFDDDATGPQPPLPPPGPPPPPGLQDGNGNHVVARARSQNRGPNDGLTQPPRDPPLAGAQPPGDGSASYAKRNPFIHEAFSDVKPSSLNPFSSFFGGGQEVGQGSPAGGRHPEPGSDSPSPARQTQNPPANLPLGGGGGGGGDLFQDGPITNELHYLRSLQPSDPDGPGGGGPSDGDEGVEEGEEALERPEEEEEEPYLPPHMVPQDGWAMLLRIPEKKTIMSSRHWGPIHVRLSDDGFLRLFYERGLDAPFRSLRLLPQHQLSEPRLQSYEDAGRVHTLSVELLQYRERRRSKLPAALSPLPTVLTPLRQQLVKLATPCYHDYLSCRHSLLQLLRRLPGPPPGPPAPPGPAPPLPSEEEMHVEVRDEFYGAAAAAGGRVEQQLVITRVSVLALVSGQPRCQLGLNDLQVKGKELVSRRDIVPNSTARWIRLDGPELHPLHADSAHFLSTRAVTFTPPPRCRFELLRFRTPFCGRSLPFSLRTTAAVAGAEVVLQSWLLMAPGGEELNAVPCEDVAIRYPIPEIWAKIFRREGVGGERSLKARFNKGAGLGWASPSGAGLGWAGPSGAEPAMRVTLGTAKYEAAFRAVVWRIPRLPDKNSALGHPHTFFLRLELGSDQEVPRVLQRHLEVEFDMPAAAASQATVRSLSVDDRPDVRKWINYKAHFFYQVPIEQKREDIPNTGNTPADQPGECAHQ